MKREGEKERGARKSHEVAEHQDSRAVETVRGMPSHQNQDHEWQELRQADETKIERIASERVDLPSDRHGLHLNRHRGQEAGAQETCKRAVSEQRSETRGPIHRGKRHQEGGTVQLCEGKEITAT